MLDRAVAVHLRHDERYVRLHPPGRRLVDRQRAAAHRLRYELARCRRADGEERDVERTLDELGARWTARDDLGKVSVVGAGMKSHPGVAAKTFATLRDHGVEPIVVTTSPIKIACHIPTDDVEKAVRALHEAFDLA